MSASRPKTRDVRKPFTLGVKLAVALRMLGFKPEDHVQFDHDPALGLRKWDEAKGDFDPPQLDTDFIVIRTKAGHREKTSGRKGEKRSTSYGSDLHVMAKADRIDQQQAEFRRRLLAKDAEPARKSRWPSRPLRSRAMRRRS